MIKKYTYLFLTLVFTFAGCADNDLKVSPDDKNFPFQLVLDADEGGDLADAEDYGLEVAFADFIGDLPETTITVDYEISDLTDDMVGSVTIDKIVYKEDDEEFELDFTPSGDGLTGTITLNDPLTDEIPEEFEIVFTLPGEEGAFFAEGNFKFTLSNLQADGANVILGSPYEFEYEVLDHELAGNWVFELDNEEDFNDFREVFGSVSPELADMEFADVKAGEAVEVEVEFEYEETNITIVYIDANDEEVEFEIEAEYDFEDGEIEFEGSHLIIGDDGEVEDELDFLVEAEYEIDGSDLTLVFFKVMDEDNYAEGEELFASETGAAFALEKD